MKKTYNTFSFRTKETKKNFMIFIKYAKLSKCFNWAMVFECSPQYSWSVYKVYSVMPLMIFFLQILIEKNLYKKSITSL